MLRMMGTASSKMMVISGPEVEKSSSMPNGPPATEKYSTPTNAKVLMSFRFMPRRSLGISARASTKPPVSWALGFQLILPGAKGPWN